MAQALNLKGQIEIDEEIERRREEIDFKTKVILNTRREEI